MALVPHWLQRVASWFVYYLLEQTGVQTILDMAPRRFPDIPEADLTLAAEEARRAIRTAEVAAALPPAAPVEAALEGEQPPDNRVGVRYLAQWRDTHGAVYWTTIKVPGEWSMTMSEAQAEADAMLMVIMGRYPGSEILSFEVVAPLRYPLPEQQ